MLSELIEKLTRRDREQIKNQKVQYAEIVRDLADGKNLDTDEVENVLKSTGKSPSELKTDVELLQQRRSWRKIIDGESELIRQQNEVVGKIDTERIKFKGLQAEHEIALQQIEHERSEIADQLRLVADAYAGMNKTSPVTRQQVAISRSDEAAGDRNALESLGRELREKQAGVRGLQAELDGQTRPFSSEANIKKQIAVTEHQIFNLESQIEAINSRTASRRDRCEELQEAVLTP